MAAATQNSGWMPVRRALAVLLFALGLGLAAIALGLGLVNIAPLRERLLDAALAAARDGETRIEIGRLGGVWPGRLRLGDIRVSDAEGVWATLESLELDWRPLALWRGEVHVTRLELAGLDVVRGPLAAESGSESADFVLPRLPVLPVTLRLDNFNARDMTFGAALAGEEIRFTAQGHLLHGRRESDIALLLQRPDGGAGHADLQYRFLAGPERGLLKLSLADGEAGRPSALARLAGLDGVGRLAIEIDGQSLAGLMTGRAAIDAGPALVLEADAHGALGERANLRFRLAAEGDTVARELDFLDDARALTASGRLAQTGSDSYRLAEARVAAGGLTLAGDATAVRRGGHYDIEAAGTAEGLAALFDGAGGDAGPVGWQLTGQADAALSQATIATAALSGLGGTAHFAGRAGIDLGSGAAEADGDIEAVFADLAPLGILSGQTMSGAVEARIEGFRFADGRGSGRLTLRAGPVATGDAALDRLLAAGLTAEGDAGFDAGGGWSLGDVAAAAGDNRLTGRFAMTAAGAMDGAAVLTLAEIGDVAGDVARGALTAEAQISGAPGAARLVLAAELRDGAAAGIDIARATLDTTLTQGGSGPALLLLEGDDGRARIATQVTLPAAGGARFAAIEADMFGAALTGAVALSPAGIASGEIAGRRVALAPLGRLAGLALEGRGEIALTLSERQGMQDASLSLTARRIELDLAALAGETLSLDQVELTAALRDLHGAGRIAARLGAAGGAAGNTVFNEIAARATGPFDAIALEARLAGERLTLRNEPVAFSADGIWQADALTVTALSLTLGETSMALAQPLRLGMPAGGGLEMPQLALTFDGPDGAGRLDGAMRLGRRAVQLSFEAETLPLALLTPLLPSDAAGGTMSGRVRLDSGRESGEMALRFAGVRLTDAGLDTQPAFDATLDAAWAARRLTLEALAHGVSEEPFRLNATLPLVRDPAGAWPMLAARGAVSGDLTWHGPIASLMALADLPGQRLTGDAAIALGASGDISAPLFSGRATLDKGTFENFVTGMALRDVTLRIEGARSEVLDFTLTARDGGAGRLDAGGTISLAAARAQAVLIEARFAGLQVARRRDVTLAVSGDLALTGAALPPTREEPFRLGGALTTTDALFVIPEQLPSGVPHIAVIEINGPDDDAARRTAEEAVPFPVALDLALAIGNPPAQLSGRGVNALWSGDLTVGGTADAPRISGVLRSLRGTLDFAGKTFTLSRGIVTFRGASPPDPEIDIALDYGRGDFKATVAVSGRGSAPVIALRAQPDMPQDEIISRILFEKGVGELSAFEAAQLANTAAQLSGAGGIGGFGLLGEMQRSLGLDVLRVDAGASGGTTVAAGKYLREGFYVGVEQGALASDSSVKVEIDLNENISVDTRIGQDASSGGGINWKWDY